MSCRLLISQKRKDSWPRGGAFVANDCHERLFPFALGMALLAAINGARARYG
jgi:hypothetical protein